MVGAPLITVVVLGLSVVNSEFAGNSAFNDGSGGAIDYDGGLTSSLSLSQVALGNNKAENGGGIEANGGGPITVTNCNFGSILFGVNPNVAAGDGGRNWVHGLIFAKHRQHILQL